jgi:hypothetical protein
MARWVRTKDPHHPGWWLREGRKTVGRVLRAEFTRTYSCFVGEASEETWLGSKVKEADAKRLVLNKHNEKSGK